MTWRCDSLTLAETDGTLAACLSPRITCNERRPALPLWWISSHAIRRALPDASPPRCCLLIHIYYRISCFPVFSFLVKPPFALFCPPETTHFCCLQYFVLVTRIFHLLEASVVLHYMRSVGSSHFEFNKSIMTTSVHPLILPHPAQTAAAAAWKER